MKEETTTTSTTTTTTLSFFEYQKYWAIKFVFTENRVGGITERDKFFTRSGVTSKYRDERKKCKQNKADKGKATLQRTRRPMYT